MSVRINMNVKQFQQQLHATAIQMMVATRPAAQAGAQIIYARDCVQLHRSYR